MHMEEFVLRLRLTITGTTTQILSSDLDTNVYSNSRIMKKMTGI